MKTINYFMTIAVAIVMVQQLCTARSITFKNNTGLWMSIDYFIAGQPIEPSHHFILSPQNSNTVDIDTLTYKSFIASDTGGKRIIKEFSPSAQTYVVSSEVQTSPASPSGYRFLSVQAS